MLDNRNSSLERLSHVCGFLLFEWIITLCLFADQLAGLEWLRTLHEVGLNGILADEMGLGKRKHFR